MMFVFEVENQAVLYRHRCQSPEEDEASGTVGLRHENAFGIIYCFRPGWFVLWELG